MKFLFSTKIFLKRIQIQEKNSEGWEGRRSPLITLHEVFLNLLHTTEKFGTLNTDKFLNLRCHSELAHGSLNSFFKIFLRSLHRTRQILHPMLSSNMCFVKAGIKMLFNCCSKETYLSGNQGLNYSLSIFFPISRPL